MALLYPALLLLVLLGSVSGETSVCTKAPVDLLLLFDTSDSVSEADFQEFQQFSFHFLNLFELGPQAMRISMASFGSTVDESLTLNDPIKGLSGAVAGIVKVGGSRFLNQAIAYAGSDVFTASKGDDQNAPNMVVLITNGRSADPVTGQTLADMTSSVNFVVITVGSDTDNDEILTIAGKQSDVMQVDSANALENKTSVFDQIFCNALVESGGGQPYTVPENPTCNVQAIYNRDEDIVSVIISCQSDNNRPEAVCDFYRITNGGEPIPLNADVSYNHNAGDTDHHYKTRCLVFDTVGDMGPGNHTFRVLIYPGVTGGQDLVNATDIPTVISLWSTVTDHVCPENMLDDYLCGASMVCNCSIVTQGFPKGKATWYNSVGAALDTHGVDVTYDQNNSGQVHSYTCEGVSAIGRNVGSYLTIGTESACSP